MASDGGRADRSVAAQLAAEPYRFDFFKAVSLLEGMSPDGSPVGEGVHPERERVRFSADPSLDFPASEIAGLEAPTGPEEPWRMRVAFMALAGVQGPLPRSYIERMLGPRARTAPLREFLDIFHHRLVSIFYRARRTRRLALDGKRPEESIAVPMLRALMGMGGDGLANRLAVPDRALLRYAGLFALRPRTVAGLQAILTSYFGVAVQVDQFIGQWRDLEPEDTSTLGTTGRANVLGQNAVLGTRVWDQSAAIRLTLGPLTAAQYQDLLPTGTALNALRDLVKLYIGQATDVEIRLVLRAGETPEARLDSPAGPALGWTSWLDQPVRTEDPQITLARESS